mgnify:CR=1 FL=1
MDDKTDNTNYEPWNKGKLIGQKAPLKVKDIWSIRIRLQLQNQTRDLALFNLPWTANCATATW